MRAAIESAVVVLFFLLVLLVVRQLEKYPPDRYPMDDAP